MQQRTVVGKVTVVQRQNERAVVGAVGGHFACFGVDEVGELSNGVGDRFFEFSGKWKVGEFSELNGIQVNMKDETMVVEGVHRVSAIEENLFGGGLLEEVSSEGEIFFGVFEFREEQADHPQAEGFADGVVTARGDVVADVFIDTVRLRGN